MKTLGSLLSSAGKTELLRALIYQQGSVGLRQVARIAAIHPHSAEMALDALVREGLVRRRRTSTRVLYEMVWSHEDVTVLKDVFAAAETGFIRARSCILAERARSLLPFIKQATRMITHSRESRHVA